jgi:hypothetical protein
MLVNLQVFCIFRVSPRGTNYQPNHDMKTTRSRTETSRFFKFKGIPVICYKNKFGNAPIAWMIYTQGEWSSWPMTRDSIRYIVNRLAA